MEGFWTCLTDHIGAGSFETPKKDAPAKHRWELFFARQDSPIAREIMSEICRAKDSFLEALQGAEVDPDSDMVQNSFLSVPDTGFGLGFGKLQHAISDELLKYRAKALGIRARKLPPGRPASHGFSQSGRMPVRFPAPLRLPVALGPFHTDFVPFGHSAHLWSTLDGSSTHRWI